MDTNTVRIISGSFCYDREGGVLGVGHRGCTNRQRHSHEGARGVGGPLAMPLPNRRTHYCHFVIRVVLEKCFISKQCKIQCVQLSLLYNSKNKLHFKCSSLKLISGFVRGITKSYKVLYLFLKNKTSYKVLYFFDRSYIFFIYLIFMSYFGCVLSVCQSLYLKTRP